MRQAPRAPRPAESGRGAAGAGRLDVGLFPGLGIGQHDAVQPSADQRKPFGRWPADLSLRLHRADHQRGDPMGADRRGGGRAVRPEGVFARRPREPRRVGPGAAGRHACGQRLVFAVGRQQLARRLADGLHRGLHAGRARPRVQSRPGPARTAAPVAARAAAAGFGRLRHLVAEPAPHPGERALRRERRRHPEEDHRRFAGLAAAALVLARDGKAPLSTVRQLYDNYQSARARPCR